MDICAIKKIIKNKEASILDTIHESAVVVPLIEVDDELHILFEVRSHSLNSQPGEICFPGGKIENDESSMCCAVRETSEELNISENNIEIIGRLDYLMTPFNMAIYPYCGLLNNIKLDEIEFNRNEVSSIFTVPLKKLLLQEPKVSNMKINVEPLKNFPFHLIQNGSAYGWKAGKYPVYFYEYEDNVIWGITAKILKNFLDRINNAQ